MIFLASSIFEAISFIIMVFVRLSTLTVPRSLKKICSLISSATEKSTGKYSVISGSNFLACSRSASLLFLSASSLASASSIFLRSSASIFWIFALVVTQITFPWRLIPSSLFERRRARAWSHGTFLSLIDTMPFTSGPQIMFKSLTSPISLKILVTSAFTKSMVMGAPVCLPVPRPGIIVRSLLETFRASRFIPVSVDETFSSSTSFTGTIFFSGCFTGVGPKSMQIPLSVWSTWKGTISLKDMARESRLSVEEYPDVTRSIAPSKWVLSRRLRRSGGITVSSRVRSRVFGVFLSRL